jgi:hypothetical protein
MSLEKEVKLVAPAVGITKDVEAVGKDLLQTLSFEEPVADLSRHVPAVFARVRDMPAEIVEFSLSPRFGRKLKEFVEAVDLSHPDISSLFEGCLGNQSDFGQDVLELLTLGEYAFSHNLTRVLPNLTKKVICQEKERRQCLRALGDPRENCVHVRLLQEASLRDKARQKKSPQIIELGIITRKGDELWSALQGSFRTFVRGMPVYREEIENAERKAKRFKALGCSGLADEIDKSIDGFRVQVSECYHGFNRVTLTVTAVILAKAHGYMMSTSLSHWESGDRRCTIKVPKGKFYDFGADQEGYRGLTQQLRMSSSDYPYQPRAYPAHFLDNMVSEQTKKLMAHLDQFPETGGRPIFDHFIVIVPGVKYPVVGHDDYWRIRLPNGEIETFATGDLAAEALDMILLRKGYIHPVLLGERDGKCYFIDYWKGRDEEEESSVNT